MLTKDEIAELVVRIQSSGVLGRSSIYPRLLNYLVEKAALGHSCSEVDLAEHVFFKKDSFDQKSDSSVRVYVYNLRKKLQLYYEGDGKEDTYRINIPKGEYRVEFLDLENYAKALEGKSSLAHRQSGLPIQKEPGRGIYPLWGGLALLFALITMVTVLYNLPQQPIQIEYSDEQLAFWGGVLLDDKPVRILLNNTPGRFGVQSSSVSSLASEQSVSQSQREIQTEVPVLLIRLVAMLEGVNRPIEISYLSELSLKEITGESHIIYTDHVDGIGKLVEVFNGVEQLEPADLVQNLLAKHADVLRSGQLSSDDPRATDYGLIFSESLHLPNGDEFEFIVLAGSGFAGQSAVVQIAQSTSVLTEMQLTEGEALSGGLSALFQITASDEFHAQRTLLSSEAH